jgi:hypothetical protein
MNALTPTQNTQPAKPTSPELSAGAERLDWTATWSPDDAVRLIANDPALLAEARAILPALERTAKLKAGHEGVKAVIGRRFALYPQPPRSEAEGLRGGRTTSTCWPDVQLASLEAAMRAYVADPDSEFMPKPGKLRELAFHDALSHLRPVPDPRRRPLRQVGAEAPVQPLRQAPGARLVGPPMLRAAARTCLPGLRDEAAGAAPRPPPLRLLRRGHDGPRNPALLVAGRRGAGDLARGNRPPMTTSKRVGRQKHVKAMENAQRRRLMVLEHRERARQVAAEVREGVSETVALSEGRGDQFLAPPVKPGEPPKPTRRKTGLETLLARKVITKAKFDLGEKWGTLWRMATDDPSIRSGAAEPEGGSNGDPIGSAITQAKMRIAASERLAELNLLLVNQPSLIHAMAEVAGEGRRPGPQHRTGGTRSGSSAWSRSRWTCWRTRRPMRWGGRERLEHGAHML